MTQYSEPTDHLAISDAEIRRQLDRILEFREFQASRRRREMLKFIVEEALAGRASGLKGTAIAMAVFGRGPDFDQQTDPVVRLEARKLRRDLDNYYAGTGRDDPVRIDIPKGRYVPVFNYQRAPRDDAPADRAGQTDKDAAEPVRWRRVPRRQLVLVLAAVAVVVVLASLIFQAGNDGAVGGAQSMPEASLLVEGFRAVGESEDTALIAEGVTQVLVSNLLRFGHLRVHFVPVAIGSDGAAEDETDPPPTQFALSGTVRLDGETIAVRARLVRNDDGRVLWSEAFAEAVSAENLMRTEVELAARIATIIGQQYGMIQTVVQETAVASNVDPAMDSFVCVARALVYRRTVETRDYETARGCLEAAVKRDADYADAWAMLAYLRLDAARFGYDPDISGDEGFYSAKQAALRALVIDPENIEAYKALSAIEEYLGDFDAAISMAERAVALNPNAPDALANLGNRLSMRGRLEEGVPLLKRALDRSVKPVPFYYQMIAVDYMMRDEWDEMLAAASRAVADNSSASHALLAVAHAGLGNARLAHKHLDAMAERWPLLAEDPRAAFEHYRLDPAIVDAFVDGLAMARAVSSESE